jgi:hypothetical protein
MQLFFNVLLLLGFFCALRGMDKKEDTLRRKKSEDGSIAYIQRTSKEISFAEKKGKKGKETFDGYKRPIQETPDKSNSLSEEEKAKLWHELHAKYKKSLQH